MLLVYTVVFVLLGQCYGHPGLWYSSYQNSIVQFGTDTRINLNSYSQMSFPIQQFALVLNTPIPLLFVQDSAGSLFRVLLKAPNQVQQLHINFTSWSLSQDQAHLYFAASDSLSRCGLNGQKCEKIHCSLTSSERFVGLVDANETTAYAIKEYMNGQSAAIFFYSVDLTDSTLQCSPRRNQINENSVHLLSGRFVIRNSSMLRFTIQGAFSSSYKTYGTSFTENLNLPYDNPNVICSGPGCSSYFPLYFSALKQWGLIPFQEDRIYTLLAPPQNLTKVTRGLKLSDLKAYINPPVFFETATTLPPNVGCPNYCNLNGLCSGTACQCMQNYFTEDCGVYCFAQSTCSGHGVCNTTGGCDCDPGWGGDSCGTYTPIVPPVFPPDFTATATFQGDGLNTTLFSPIVYSSLSQFLEINGSDGNNSLSLYEYGILYTFTNITCQSSNLPEAALPAIVTPSVMFQRRVPCGSLKCDVFGSDPTDRIWFITETSKPYKVVRKEFTILFEPNSFVATNFTSVPSPPSWCNSARRVLIAIN